MLTAWASRGCKLNGAFKKSKNQICARKILAKNQICLSMLNNEVWFLLLLLFLTKSSVCQVMRALCFSLSACLCTVADAGDRQRHCDAGLQQV